MTLHAIQTGSARIKCAQVEGRGRGLRRRLAVFADRTWTEWLPTYAWVIDHPEGVIVVDAGQGVHLLDTRRSLLLSGRIDGVSAHDDVASATLDAIGRLARAGPTVYLPTHDPESAIRLAERRLANASERAVPQVATERDESSNAAVAG